MTELGVFSEVGKLREVMVHRPDLSLRRLTPANHNDFLFDEVIWVDRAILEHDAFVRLIRDEGVKVRYLQELLAETFASGEGIRRELIDHVSAGSAIGISSSDAVSMCLMDLGAEDLAKHLIGGLTVSELECIYTRGLARSSLTAAVSGPDAFILPPLPNSLFCRDSSSWIFNGVSINPMYWPARRPESFNAGFIYHNHPEFRTQKFGFWYPLQDDEKMVTLKDTGRTSLEGGDVMPIGKGTVIIGLSERTQAPMVERLAHSLFSKNAAERIIVAQMSRDRAHMHLDTVFCMLDVDTVTVWPDVVNRMEAYSLRAGNDTAMFSVKKEDSFLGAVADALEINRLEVIPTGGDSYEAAREQWDDGNNILTLRPGVVIAMNRNAFTNRNFRKAGIDVLEFEGSELSRGRGGGHCLTCPLVRDPA